MDKKGEYRFFFPWSSGNPDKRYKSTFNGHNIPIFEFIKRTKKT